MRAPTRMELRRALDRHVRDEVLYREALARGLDRGDPSVRQVMIRKITGLGVAQLEGPAGDDEIRAYFSLRQERYRTPGTISFIQIYLSPDESGDRFFNKAEELLSEIRGKDLTPSELAALSDATMLAGMPPGTYTWDGKTVVMTEDGMLKYPEQNVLAGASFSIRHGVTNVMKFTGCSLEDAIRMASTTPSNTFNLDDRGSIDVGKRGDLVLFKLEDNQMAIKKTYLAGNLVYSAEN